MNVKSFINYIPMVSIDSSTFSGSYQALTATTEPCIIYKIINNSTMDVTISLNGLTDHDFIPTMSGAVYDNQAGSQPGNKDALLAKNQVFYVKGSAGTGSVYLVGIMQPSSNPAGL